jgi:AraC family transcriptional activator of pobA
MRGGGDMKSTRDIPVYKLYGEEAHWLTPDMVHCESIESRSRLHNWRIKPHQHHGLFQILYLSDGTARVRLDDHHRDMRGPQVLAVPQMSIHGFDFSRNAGGQVITLAYPMFDRISQQLADALSAMTGPLIHALGEDEESAHIKLAFSRLDSEYKRDAPYRGLRMESLLGAILVWMVRNSMSMQQEPARALARGERHFAAFCQMVEECYAKHHPIAHYAGQIGITSAHLNALCRQAVNQSALALIHDRMLLEAKRSLVYTSMTVSVVSYSLGFADPAYFTRFFKRQTGMSPKEFRVQAKTLV